MTLFGHPGESDGIEANWMREVEMMEMVDISGEIHPPSPQSLLPSSSDHEKRNPPLVL